MNGNKINLHSKTALLLIYSPHKNWQTGASQTFMKLVNKINKEEFDVTILVQKVDPNLKTFNAINNVSTIECIIPNSLDLYDNKLLSFNPILNVSRLISIMKYYRKVKKLILRMQPDVIWSLNWRGVISVSPVINKQKIPFIYQIGLGIESVGIRKYLNEILLNLSSNIIIESEAQISKLYTSTQVENNKSKFKTIPFGIDTELFSKTSIETEIDDFKYLKNENYFVIGSVCQLHPRKGITELIEIVSLLQKRTIKELHLIIVGGDPSPNEKYYNEMINLIKQNNMEEFIHLVGWKKQETIPTWLSLFDIFVLYTTGEGIPVSIREAMSMKIPVVSTNVGGISDIVKNDYNGKLVSLGSKVEFSESIYDLVENVELLEKMKHNARETIVGKFSLDKQIKEYEQFFVNMSLKNS